MELSRGQFFAIIGAVVAVVVIVVGWALFKPGAGGSAEGSQVDMLSTDPQFANPNAAQGDSAGTLPPQGNAPM